MSVEVTDNNFEEIIHSGKPVVIKFQAPWCSSCRMLEPLIDQIESELGESIIFGSLDVDTNSTVPTNLGIRNLPTILFYKDGLLVDRQVGVTPKSTLMVKINNLL